MKLAFTIADSTAACFGGGEVERETCVIEVDSKTLPKPVADYLSGITEFRKTGKTHFLSASISIVFEESQ